MKANSEKKSKSESSGGKVSSLHGLFVSQLKDIYYAEQQLVKAMPKVERDITTKELKDAVQDHFEETEDQVKRLEEVFSIIGEEPAGTKCEAMEGLIKEAEKLREEISDPMTKDAAIIAGLQKIEHYEIATYGCLRTYAQTLGFDEAADLLQETLDEEEEADSRLTELAESSVNVEASENGGSSGRTK